MDAASSEASALQSRLPRRSRLTRLREVLVEHNWLGVAIEIMIVMVGVLLAFEFEQWGQERSRAADERQFLGRLYDEYGRAAEELRLLNKDHEKVRSDVGQVFAARRDPPQLARLAMVPELGCSLGRFRDAPYNDTSFEELVSSGRINMISDPALRGEIRDLAAAQAASARQIDTSRMLMLSQIPTLDNYYRFDIGQSGKASCVVDWPRLMTDQKAMNAAVRAYRVNGFSLEARTAVLQRITDLRGRLACRLGRSECRR